METIITNVIAISALAVVIVLAVIYIVKAKKNGRKCIGCPDSKICSSSDCKGDCQSCSACSFKEE